MWRQSDAIHIARTDDLGAALAPAVPLQTSTEYQSWPTITSNGAGLNLVTWRQTPGTHLLMVDDDGVPTWSGSQLIVDGNRLESFSYSIAGGHGRVAVAWESDVDTVYPLITVGTIATAAADIPPPADHVVSDPTFPCYSPRAAISASYTAIGFRCSAAGARRLFITQVSP